VRKAFNHIIVLLFLALVAGFVACKKADQYTGRFGQIPININADSPSYRQYFYFFNVVIDSNATYTFDLPELTQAIIDTGVVQVYFRTALIVPNQYDLLPVFTIPNGKIVVVNLVSIEVGKITVAEYGPTTPPMNYMVYLASSQ
jgi:hypothetical protein